MINCSFKCFSAMRWTPAEENSIFKGQTSNKHRTATLKLHELSKNLLWKENVVETQALSLLYYIFCYTFVDKNIITRLETKRLGVSRHDK